MSSDTNRAGECNTCVHLMSVHTREKCKRCGKGFEICQAGNHGPYSTAGSGGWRICKSTCYCGKDYFPDKVKAAKELQPHEYREGHEAYRALPEDNYDTEDDWGEDSAGGRSQYSSPPAQGGASSQGHTRAISESSDELAWSKARWEMETGGMDDLAQKFGKVHMREEWGEWSWNKDGGNWKRTDKSTGAVGYAPLQTEWSEWVPDKNRENSWYSAAQDPAGKWHYEYTQPQQKGGGSNQQGGNEEGKQRSGGKAKVKTGKGKGKK